MYRYYLVQVPDEYHNNGDTVQVFIRNAQGVMDYLMDFTALKRICLEKGWPVPCGGHWCEFHESLEYASLEQDVAAVHI